MSDPRVESFWDATLDEDEVDYDAYLEGGGEEILEAVNLHKALRGVGQRWRTPDRPKQLGRFEILGHLGSGGLGRVWLGWDPELRRNVAIKVIERDNWAQNEARSIARLDHRAVVKVFEVGFDRLVMEVLDGGSLQDEIEVLRAGEASHLTLFKDRLLCLLHIAEGLAYCHERGVLHRDVKPGNVLFARDDPYPRLIDFGLAHVPGGFALDITQNLVGSPAYIAPEQIELGETGADPRSDQFSFGVLAYELLTLQNPFLRDTRTRTLDAVREARPPAPRRCSPEIPEPVQRILLHCLEPDPRDRYQEMSEVVSDLRDVLADRPISIGRRGSIHLARLWYRRNRRLTQVGLAGVAVAALLGMSLWGKSVHAARNELLSEVRVIDDRLPRLKQTTELNEAGLSLIVARLRGEQFDGGRVAPLLFGSARPEIDAVAESWSRRLGAAAAEAERTRPETFPASEWRMVFQLDEDLCPGAEWNKPFQDRGRLLLSEELSDHQELRLLEQGVRGTGLLSGYRDFHPIELSTPLSKGYYRLAIPGEWEREFIIESDWPLPTRIERTPRRIPRERLHEDPALPELCFSEIITFAQYDEFCSATGYSFSRDSGSSADEPFWGTWSQAQAYAVWVGGRLPLAEELGDLFASGFPRPDDRLSGELVSDITEDEIGLGASLFYKKWREKGDSPARSWWVGLARTERVDYGDAVRAIGFRVVYPR